MKAEALGSIRAILLAAIPVLVLFVTACEEPSAAFDARLGDFFDDLGDASSNSDHAQLVDRHFHPDTQSLSAIRTAEFWEGTKFDSPNVSSYSWTRGDDTSSDDHGGTQRVSVRVNPSGRLAFDADFYMKESGGEQKIRALDDNDPDRDDVLIKSLPTPLYSP